MDADAEAEADEDERDGDEDGDGPARREALEEPPRTLLLESDRIRRRVSTRWSAFDELGGGGG